MCSLYAQDINFHMTQTSIALFIVLTKCCCNVVVMVSFMFQLFISKFNTHYPENN